MRTGEAVTAAPGKTSDKVLSLDAAVIMGSIRADVQPMTNYRARNYALFTGGVWRNNEHISSAAKSVRVAVPIEPGATTVSVAVVEAGDHEAFDESNYVPGGWVKEEESADAARVRIQWQAGYLVDEANGEGSLTSVVFTGVSRFANCEPDEKFGLTRGRIWYSIQTSGTTHFVRLWSNGLLVASGSRIGDGLVTFAANNSSGLTGQAILTYSADIEPGTYFIVCRWPRAYNIHYSTTALSFPRTAEMTVYDKGVLNYIVITPILAAGNYNYAVQAVGDDTTLQTTPATPADSPKLVKSPPLPVVLGAYSGNYNAITVNYANPVANGPCTFVVYSSMVDEPVNMEQWPLPIPIARPIGSSSVVLAPVANWQPLDRTTAWNTYWALVDGVVAAMNAAYDTGYTGFAATLAAQELIAQDGLVALSLSTGIPTPEHNKAIAQLFTQLSEAAALGSQTEVADWQSFVNNAFSSFLTGMSLMLQGTTGRYTYSDGSLPYSGTGTADGDAGSLLSDGQSSATSVYSLVSPLITNRWVRVVIRATRVSDGLTECNDEVLEIELDANGDVVQPRPNAANIESITVNGLAVTFKVQQRTDDQEVAAATLAVYSASAPSSPTYVTPIASGAAGSAITGLVTASLTYTYPAPGYYVVAAKGVSAAGVQSGRVKETTIFVGSEQPAAAQAVKAAVIRATPDEAEADD